MGLTSKLLDLPAHFKLRARRDTNGDVDRRVKDDGSVGGVGRMQAQMAAQTLDQVQEEMVLLDPTKIDRAHLLACMMTTFKEKRNIHTFAARYYRRLDIFCFYFPLLLLHAAVAVVYLIAPESLQKNVSGVVSAVTTVILGMQMKLKWGETSRKFEFAARQYASLAAETFPQWIVADHLDGSAFLAFLDKSKAAERDVENTCPVPPVWIMRKFETHWPASPHDGPKTFARGSDGDVEVEGQTGNRNERIHSKKRRGSQEERKKMWFDNLNKRICEHYSQMSQSAEQEENKRPSKQQSTKSRSYDPKRSESARLARKINDLTTCRPSAQFYPGNSSDHYGPWFALSEPINASRQQLSTTRTTGENNIAEDTLLLAKHHTDTTDCDNEVTNNSQLMKTVHKQQSGLPGDESIHSGDPQKPRFPQLNLPSSTIKVIYNSNRERSQGRGGGDVSTDVIRHIDTTTDADEDGDVASTSDGAGSSGSVSKQVRRPLQNGDGIPHQL